MPPAPAASGSSKTLLIVLGVVFGLILLVVVGVYAAFHMVANKVRALAAGDTQTSSQAASSSTGGSAGEAAQNQVAGNAMGSILGTDAKGKSDIGNALNNMAQAGRQIEQHQQATGDPNAPPNAQDTQQAVNAVGGLLGALGHSLGGAHRHDPVDFHTLEALLPTEVAGMQRGVPRGESNQAMGIKATNAEVDFTGTNTRINVSIKDATAISGLAGLAKLANAQESEQGDSYEKNITIDGRTVHAKWDGTYKHGELSMLVGNRFGVDITGDGVDMDTLKAALAQIDLGKLESMKDANPTAQ